MAKNEVSIVIRAKNMMASGIAKARRALSGLVSGARRVGEGMAKGLAVAAAGMAAMVAAGAKLVGLYKTQAQAEAKRNTVLEATGYAAGFTATELNKQAAALQKVTGYGDETILSMQGLLMSFKMIRGDNFQRAQAAALDMASAMKKAGADQGTVEESARALGMALEDPIEGLSRLRRSGLIVSDAMRDQIKLLQENGDLQGSQALLLTEVESRYKGVAAAMNAADGGIQDVKNTLGDMGEEFGKAIVQSDGFKAIMAKVKTVLEDLVSSGTLDKWIGNIGKAFEAMKPIVSWIIDALKTVWSTLNKTGAAIGSFVAALKEGKGLGEATAAGRATFSNYEAQAAAQEKARAAKFKEKKAAEEIKQIEAERIRMAQVSDGLSTNEAAKANKIAELKQKQLELEKKIAEEKDHQVKADAIQEKIAAEQNKAGAAGQVAEDAQRNLEDLQKQTLRDFIAERQAERKEGRNIAKQEKKDKERLEKLQEKSQKRGVKLAKKDQEELAAGLMKQRKEEMWQKMRFDAQEIERKAQEDAKRLQKEAKDMADKSLQELIDIRKKLEENLKAPGG